MQVSSNSAFYSGVSGLNRSFEQLNSSASNIASLTMVSSSDSTSMDTNQVSLTDELVNLKVAEQQGKVSAKVIDTADKMLGSLIDISA